MVATELRREREDAFVVTTDEADLRAVLPALAYAQEAEDEFVRRFPASDSAQAIHTRFSACVSALLDQTARREPPPWKDSLEDLHRLLAAGGVDWMLSGSAALAVRGVEIVPRDVDLVVADHRATVDALGHLLIEPPVCSHGGWIAEWFGRAWNGTRLEWVAGTRPDLDDHEWTSDIDPDAVRRAETVEWRGLRFSVPPLDLQTAVSRERGLHDRVAAIVAVSR